MGILGATGAAFIADLIAPSSAGEGSDIIPDPYLEAQQKGERGYTGPGDRNINPDKHKKYNPRTGKWEKKDPHTGKWKPTTPPENEHNNKKCP